MKKIYNTPEAEIVELNLLRPVLLDTSIGAAEGGNSDGGTQTTTTDPTDPEWGSDY